LQEVPIAISLLSAEQLALQSVHSLDDLRDGTVTSLRLQPYADSPSLLVVTLRGNGPGDVRQVTRDNPVAVYLDHTYLGRAHGLAMELTELERIEVLRGPQGVLFGRNATGGAISLISKQPSGELGLRQQFSCGRFNELNSRTHLDLPEWQNLRVKIDYLHRERDGWVDNTAPGQEDYNSIDRSAGRIALQWQAREDLQLNYAYTMADTAMSQNYYQAFRDYIGVFGDEPIRENRTRFDIAPLEPSEAKHRLHSFSLHWDISDKLRFESLSSYGEITDRVRNNYGGVVYFDGLISVQDVDQEQQSQEFRLLGHNVALQSLLI
jgi:iron complex outermembrane receptor protein